MKNGVPSFENAVRGNVRAEIARHGFRMDNVAESIGLSKARLSSRLNGHTSFSLKELFRLADVLGVGNVGDLLPSLSEVEL
ncbi:MAG: helix-turn-helix transcriptional regulator [Arcanobacterium sp.]|nr:helix-turn-helix transcriptional regulator [Arcanobacterium sp.]MDY6142911.1 helix-turn-helix transcriptional regulator [Arcanobacterium sp.]